jgi:hypothetical protein
VPNASAEILTGVPVLRAFGAGEMLALKSGRFGCLELLCNA